MDPRIAVIEGRRALIVERHPPLPPSLTLLLEGGRGPDGRYWSRLTVTARQPLNLGGAAASCLRDDHRLSWWLDGLHTGSDGMTRSLRLNACSDCGAVQVRDVSFDDLTSHDPLGRGVVASARRPPRRKSLVIGWYSGARPNQRTYS